MDYKPATNEQTKHWNVHREVTSKRLADSRPTRLIGWQPEKCVYQHETTLRGVCRQILHSKRERLYKSRRGAFTPGWF